MHTGKKAFVRRIFFLAAAIAIAVGIRLLFHGSQQESGKWETLDDVLQKPVGMTTGVAYADIARENGFFDEKTVVMEYNTELDAIEAMRGGKIGSAFTSNLYAAEYVAQYDDIMIFPTSVGIMEYAFAFQKGDPLCTEFNLAMAELKEEGLEEMLTEKWLTGNASSRTTVEITGRLDKGMLRYWANTGTPPMVFVAEGGEYIGYAVDFVRLVAERMGYDVQISECTFAGLIPALVSGAADLAGRAIAVTEERKKTVDFSDTFVSSDIVLLVRKDNVSEALLSDNGEAGIREKKDFLLSAKESFVSTFLAERRWEMFLDGIGVTMLITLLSAALGSLLGLGMDILFLRKNKAINTLMLTLNGWITGIPAVVLLMLAYYVIFKNSILDGVGVAVVTFSVVFAIGVFGLLRTGAEAVGSGQLESAYDLGFTPLQTFFQIVLPQSILHIMPLYRAKVVEHLKATAIVGYIAVLDLTKTTDLIRSRTFEAFFPLVMTAIMYYLLGRLLNYLLCLAETGMRPENRRKRLLKGVDLK